MNLCLILKYVNNNGKDLYHRDWSIIHFNNTNNRINGKKTSKLWFVTWKYFFSFHLVIILKYSHATCKRYLMAIIKFKYFSSIFFFDFFLKWKFRFFPCSFVCLFRTQLIVFGASKADFDRKCICKCTRFDMMMNWYTFMNFANAYEIIFDFITKEFNTYIFV